MSNRNKSIISLLMLLVATVIYSGWLDDSGYEYTEQGLKRALVTYGIARGLNGVISVAQGTEVAFEPAGVGMTFTPGEILDPINDLIERFSWIVLAAAVSLGTQTVLLTMTAWHWFGVLTAILLFASLIVLWKKPFVTPNIKALLFKLTIILVILRLTVPLVAVLNQGIYTIFLEPQFTESKLELEKKTLQLEETTQEPVYDEQELGFIDRAKKMMNDASNAMNIQENMHQLKNIAADISQSVLNMIVVFLLQTLIFPLLFLWLTYKAIIAVANY